MKPMSAPELAPRDPARGVAIAWAIALVAAVVIGVFAPSDRTAMWFAVGLGACLIAGFGVQLAYGRSRGFIVRVAASAAGSLLVMGIVSLLASLIRVLVASN